MMKTTKLILLFILTTSVVLCFLPNKARIKLSEASIFYILKKGNSKEDVKSQLQMRFIKYNEGAKNLCDKEYQGTHQCENVPYIHVRFPTFSLIEGGVHINIYFDAENKIEFHRAWTSYTFI